MIRRPPRSTPFPSTPLFRSPCAFPATADRPRVHLPWAGRPENPERGRSDRKSTRLNSSHQIISYAVFCLKKKKQPKDDNPPTPHHHLGPHLTADTVQLHTHH